MSCIMWSHNAKDYPDWLTQLENRRRAIERQGYVWWDVRWKLKPQLAFPIRGYIWNTVERSVTHTANIGEESKTFNQSERRLAEEMNENLRTLGIEDNLHSPLQEFLRCERVTLTRLRLVELERLNPERTLGDFILRNGNILKTGPRSYYWVSEARLLSS